MDTSGKETVTDIQGSTKGTDSAINQMYHVSLPYKTQLAKFKKELPSFSSAQ